MTTLESPIERMMLSDEIKNYLVNAIITGALAPGERLVQTKIANQLGVSQAPVREAIRDLESMGLVENLPYKGASVRQKTAEELYEVYPIRSAIEGVAARAAAERITEKEIARLEELNELMIQGAKEGDSNAHTLHNMEFHRVIVEASGNQTLVRFWNQLHLASFTYVTVARSGQSLLDIAERHATVIDALRSRDPEQAESILRQHIEEAGKWLYNELSKTESEATKEDIKS